MKIIRIIFALLGYIKVPKEAIQISLMNEQVFKKLVEIKQFKDYLESQQTLTKFLQSGRF
jgi:hypothetical protein